MNMNNFFIGILLAAALTAAVQGQSFSDSVNVFSDSLYTADSTAVIDSAAVNDTTAIRDTLMHLQILPLSDTASFSTIYNSYEIELQDYRFTGDIFNYLPFGFVQDGGALTQPGETMLYGMGWGSITYMQNGVDINNRLTNAFDLNHYQSETIDSLEVIPFARGFVYGSNNNSAAVNLITKSQFRFQPYTRIRFIQAPDDEGYIDAHLATAVTSRLNVTLNVTNQDVLSRYIASSGGGWKGYISARYTLNNNIGFIATYNYAQLEADLNGGVNAPNKNEIDYDPLQADVVYPIGDNPALPTRYQKTKKHMVSFTTIAKLSDALRWDITLYHQLHHKEFNQNRRWNLDDAPHVVSYDQSKITGGMIKQNLALNLLSLESTVGYENVSYWTNVLRRDFDHKKVWLNSIAKLNLFNGAFVPSVFGKVLNQDSKTYTGLGADVTLNPSENIRFYIGASIYEKPYAPVVNTNYTKQEIAAAEIGAAYKGRILSASLRYFRQTNDYEHFAVVGEESDTLTTSQATYFAAEETERQGINLNLRFNTWKVLVEANGTYYFNEDNEYDTSIPEYTFKGGIYYVDTLFDANLDLKAGFNITSFGAQEYFEYDYVRMRQVYSSFNEESDAVFTTDFFVAGRVQDRAVVYFVWENLFDENYYYVPYNPKQGRGLRFGIAWEFLD